MANVRINDLPEVTVANPTDYLILDQDNGSSYETVKIQVSNAGL